MDSKVTSLLALKRKNIYLLKWGKISNIDGFGIFQHAVFVGPVEVFE